VGEIGKLLKTGPHFFRQTLFEMPQKLSRSKPKKPRNKGIPIRKVIMEAQRSINTLYQT